MRKKFYRPLLLQNRFRWFAKKNKNLDPIRNYKRSLPVCFIDAYLTLKRILTKELLIFYMLIKIKKLLNSIRRLRSSTKEKNSRGTKILLEEFLSQERNVFNFCSSRKCTSRSLISREIFTSMNISFHRGTDSAKPYF